MVLRLAAAGRGLVLQHWDDVYLVFQPSSAETHVFNETTALILQRLEHGPLPACDLRNRTEDALGIPRNTLSIEDFLFAVARLEELGLLERSPEPDQLDAGW